MTETVDREVRQDVADVLIRYATGIDARDWALFRTCFTDDCDADYGEDIGVWHSAEEITDWMRAAHEPCGPTMRRITDIAVTPRHGGVSSRSYVDALVMFPGSQAGTRATGYYDESSSTPQAWRHARRRFTTVLIQFFAEGTSVDLDA